MAQSQLPQQRLSVPAEVNETEFYTDEGSETIVTHADLEEVVDNTEKPHLRERQRYWVNKPFAFIVIYENIRENEYRYVCVEPRLTTVEQNIVDFFKEKLRASINYESVPLDATAADRSKIVRDEAVALFKRYNLLTDGVIARSGNIVQRLKDSMFDFVEGVSEDPGDKIESEIEENSEFVIQEDIDTLNNIQVQRILYYLVRDFIRFGKIDPIKRDVNIEDISCGGYNSSVFVYHSEYGEQLHSNIEFGKNDIDSFVKSLAQSAGKGISRRQPSVDATLSDGSRAQLTLGTETSDKGTNFTIRQFNEIPFTPIDLINWETYSIDQMAYLWLAIENHKSLVMAGGTASGKTTSLNAISLFMPSTQKIVSIEDTRELEIPQANWIARTTRPSFKQDDVGDIDEFDLLEDALRQRPDYVIMGEIRGEEGQTLFQLLNTGHTTYTTFHADSPSEVIRRMTTAPIHVHPTMFEALDIICHQVNVSLHGNSVRRVNEIVELQGYNATSNEFEIGNLFSWDRDTDGFYQHGQSTVLEDIKEENAWSSADLQRQYNYRRLVLAYLVSNNINTYGAVAAIFQGFMSSPDTILSLIADGKLEQHTAAIHQMKTIDIEVDPERESLIPRPRTPDNVDEFADEILRETQPLLVDYEEKDVDFAQTMKEILNTEDLSQDQKKMLQQLEQTDVLAELPEGMEQIETDSTELGTMGIDEVDEELADLFGVSEASEDVILTSENLERINRQTGEDTEQDNVQPDSEDEGESPELGSLFDEGQDEDTEQEDNEELDVEENDEQTATDDWGTTDGTVEVEETEEQVDIDSLEEFESEIRQQGENNDEQVDDDEDEEEEEEDTETKSVDLSDITIEKDDSEQTEDENDDETQQ